MTVVEVVKVPEGSETHDHTTSEHAPFVPQGSSGLALYEVLRGSYSRGLHYPGNTADFKTKPRAHYFIRTVSSYECTVPPVPEDGTVELQEPGKKKPKPIAKPSKPKDGKMGTFMGVYLPCLQNIFGVLFFIRLAWIVGTAGILEGFFIAFICCSVTFLTSISLSAIATNGFVPGGGPYFMISRNLGPEVGGAVGILFYLGTTVAGSMYVTGAVEIFIYYLVPNAKIFDEISHCFRLFGTAFLFVIAMIVMAGMRVVNKFALPGAIVVVLCIILTFIGVFVNIGGTSGTDDLRFCMVGNRTVNILKYKKLTSGDNFSASSSSESGFINCTAEGLEPLFCSSDDPDPLGVSWNGKSCDRYFVEHTGSGGIRQEKGIRGIKSGVFMDNFWPKYKKEGEIFAQGNSTEQPQAEGLAKFYVAADMTTSFILLVGVFFPSVTGIMAGSNRSGDLRDPSRSIPLGTIAATTTSSICYLAGAILFGASVHEMFIRDKFGESANGKLVIAELAVPHPKVIEVGCFLSTMGAALQSLTGAPRLLQAISQDGVVPVLAPFQRSTRFGEPLRAQLLTFAICELGILIAELESLTALITQFFLMCYLSTNTACALQSLLRAPGWRPRFRYYHWTLSMLGAVLCCAVAFMSHWQFALLAIAIGIAVYKYIEYRGAEKEWGDGIKGLALSTARYALLKLEEGPPHTKNWRPQILVLCNTSTPSLTMKHTKLLAFASQLKAGKGLTVLGTVLSSGSGLTDQHHSNAVTAKESLKALRDKFKLKGFCEALVAKDVVEGLSALIQTSGLGGLKHNTVLMGWPTTWKESGSESSVRTFVETVRLCHTAHQALFVLKNIDKFPDNSEKLYGKIDVWWVVHDGGLLLLTPFLLRQNKTWKGCRLRVFVVAELEDNSVKMKNDLIKFMYQLRIDAEVEVIEMNDRDISVYTYERTLLMQQRNQVLKQLRLSEKEKVREIQSVVDHYIEEESAARKMSMIAEGNELKSPLTDTTVLEDGSELLRVQPDKANNKNNSLTVEKPSSPAAANSVLKVTIDDFLVRRMDTAVKLNPLIRNRSGGANLVILNLPPPPETRNHDDHYMEFIEVLTEGLDRVLLVRGGGYEVVTIYS